jgi:TRAP-type C4-dicarboxylate transport system substrate-binding protein
MSLRHAVLAITAAALVPLAAGAQVVIKLGTVAPEGSIWHDTLLDIREQWRTISNGEVELRIYAGGVLGGEEEMVRKMQRRGLDAAAVSGSGLPLIDSVIGCLNLPLAFTSYEQLDYVRERIAPSSSGASSNAATRSRAAEALRTSSRAAPRARLPSCGSCACGSASRSKQERSP